MWRPFSGSPPGWNRITDTGGVAGSDGYAYTGTVAPSVPRTACVIT